MVGAGVTVAGGGELAGGVELTGGGEAGAGVTPPAAGGAVASGAVAMEASCAAGAVGALPASAFIGVVAPVIGPLAETSGVPRSPGFTPGLPLASGSAAFVGTSSSAKQRLTVGISAGGLQT